MTLRKHIENVNKEIAERTNVKDGKAKSFHDDIVSENKALELFKGELPEALARHVSYIERGNTFYIDNAGLTFSIKRKRVSFPSSKGWGTYNTMYASSIVIKVDKHNLADTDLMDIMDYAIKSADKKRRDKEEDSLSRLESFKTILKKNRINVDDFLSIRSAFNKLDYKDRISLEI